MIEYGDIKSKLGRELDIYAQESWETFLVSSIGQHNGSSRLFLLVAVIIVMIYAAILLPIYQHMGDVFK